MEPETEDLPAEEGLSLWRFYGRRGRSSYRIWLLVLFIMHMLLLATVYLVVAIGLRLAELDARAPMFALLLAFPIQLLWGFLQWPLLALQSQRWRDLGYSGWLALLHLLPLAGWLVAAGLLFPPSRGAPPAGG